MKYCFTPLFVAPLVFFAYTPTMGDTTIWS